MGLRLISLPPARTPVTPLELQKLESAHKCLDLYLWLARRLPNSFPEEELADAYRTATATAISAGLQYLSMLAQKRASAKAERKGKAPTKKAPPPVNDVLSSNAVQDAFVAVERATKEVEDERERAGLERIDAAERRASTSNFKWAYAARGGDSAGLRSSASPSSSRSSSRSPSQRSSSQRSSETSSDSESQSPPTYANNASHLRPTWLGKSAR